MPFDASGATAPSLRISVRPGGECFTTSSLVAGATYRCIVGTLLHDPCYLDALAAQRRSPWAVELADGSRRLGVTGATTAVRGRRLSYVCGRARVLFGERDRSRRLWRIRMSRDDSGADMTIVPIRVACS